MRLDCKITFFFAYMQVKIAISTIFGLENGTLYWRNLNDVNFKRHSKHLVPFGKSIEW